MAEMANYLKTLANRIERNEVLRTSDYDNPFAQQKKKKPLTVADVIGASVPLHTSDLGVPISRTGVQTNWNSTVTHS